MLWIQASGLPLWSGRVWKKQQTAQEGSVNAQFPMSRGGFSKEQVRLTFNHLRV
jgi:hypothetical protein